jgi:23S rRNA-/tRNA-specific pseudouridylate synthase
VAGPEDTRARTARTDFSRLAERTPVDGQALMGATLFTGRTHQIRVHAAHAELPIVGDRKYRRDDDDATRLHLHAHRLRFDHPVTGESVDLRSALPTWASARDD